MNSNDFASLIESLDFISLFMKDYKVCLYILDVAACQSKYFSDSSIYDKLKNNIVQIAKLISEQENEILSSDDDKNYINNLLLESIYKLTIQPNNPQISSQAFSDLLSEVLIAWPNFLKNRLFSKMVQELPISELHCIWTLVLLHRALH
jgi:hypothetical protein